MGIVSQLPGASGATIAVIFRIYERLVEDVADIRNKLLKDIRFLLVLGIGFLIGYWICARLLDVFIDEHYVPMLFFFGALILIQIPEIKGFADDGEKYTMYNIAAFLVAVAVMIAVFVVKETYVPGEVDTGMAMMFVAGLIVAASFISQGISGSTILLVMGIYPAFIQALSDFNMKLLLPLGLGMIVGVLVFSRIIDHFMKNSRKSTYCAILGLTVGSVIVVFVEGLMKVDSDTVLVSVICAAAGLIFGYALLKAARIYSDAN